MLCVITISETYIVMSCNMCLYVYPTSPRFVPQQLELQIADQGLAGNEPASPEHHKKHAEARCLV